MSPIGVGGVPGSIQVVVPDYAYSLALSTIEEIAEDLKESQDRQERNIGDALIKFLSLHQSQIEWIETHRPKLEEFNRQLVHYENEREMYLKGFQASNEWLNRSQEENQRLKDLVNELSEKINRLQQVVRLNKSQEEENQKLKNQVNELSAEVNGLQGLLKKGQYLSPSTDRADERMSFDS